MYILKYKQRETPKKLENFCKGAPIIGSKIGMKIIYNRKENDISIEIDIDIHVPPVDILNHQQTELICQITK